MLQLLKWKKKRIKTLTISQRNLSGQSIEKGERVKVIRSKEDPYLIDIISISSPKRIIRNVPKTCVMG